ncbi:uncharacterized protein [Amphiura filiformis]|uniref:uncharacterized protein n=1 Tax=Amphiura filiformis TaxID=82378 RepID=UPI003B20F596
MGHVITAYIDDSLLIARTEEQAARSVRDTAKFLETLGFIIHPEKSVFTPTQEIVYLGFKINSNEMTVSLPTARKLDIKMVCNNLLDNDRHTIKTVARVIGKLVAALPAVQYGALYYRLFERGKIRALKANHGHFDRYMTISNKAKRELQWWIDNVDTAYSCIYRPKPEVYLTSDASGQGWGGSDGTTHIGGRWNANEASIAERNEINYLELLAAFFVLKAFCRNMSNKHVRISIDNTTAVAYIAHMGGSKSQDCCPKSIQDTGVPEETTNIILSSWRSSTKSQYHVYIRKWLRFCNSKQIDPMQTDAVQVLIFLPQLFKEGLTYNSLNVARSALSSLVILQAGRFTVGTHPLVTRFMKGVYTKRPPVPRYEFIWDVQIVLNYLRKLAPANVLSLKDLTLKLVMLIALVSAQRSQTIHKLCLDSLYYSGSTANFQITGLIKQSRPGKGGLTVKLQAYAVDRRLCVVTYLKHYIYRTQKLRGKAKQLFISFKKPHKPVSKDSISRWINLVMKDAGVDISRFKPHSTRAAATSAADKLGVPISLILKAAGWSNERTFRKYYDKPLEGKQTGIARPFLNKNLKTT